jgi:hypothetical protein
VFWIELTGALLMLAGSALVLFVVIESDRPELEPRRAPALQAAAAPSRRAA